MNQVHVRIFIVFNPFLKEVVKFRLKLSRGFLKFIFSWPFREKQDASYTLHLFDISTMTVRTEGFAKKIKFEPPKKKDMRSSSSCYMGLS